VLVTNSNAVSPAFTRTVLSDAPVYEAGTSPSPVNTVAPPPVADVNSNAFAAAFTRTNFNA